MKAMRMLSGFTILAATLAVGCSRKPAPAAPTNYTQAAVQAGGVLNSDGTVTNPNGSVTQPNGTVIPASQVTPPQVQNSQSQVQGGPAAAPSNQPYAGTNTAPQSGGVPLAAAAPIQAPPRPALTAARGTPITIRTTETLSASRNEVGDRFDGVLERDVTSHGAIIFTRGTPVSGEVVASKHKGRFKGAGDLGIELTAIGREHVSTTEYEQFAKGRGKRTGAFIGGGAGVGALIGGLAGGGKGALIGGLAGAGGGTAASAYTGNRDVIIRPESLITFRLTAPVTR